MHTVHKVFVSCYTIFHLIYVRVVTVHILDRPQKVLVTLRQHKRFKHAVFESVLPVTAMNPAALKPPKIVTLALSKLIRI